MKDKHENQGAVCANIDMDELCDSTKDSLSYLLMDEDDDLQEIAEAYCCANRRIEHSTTDGGASSAIKTLSATRFEMMQFFLDIAVAAGFKVEAPNPCGTKADET